MANQNASQLTSEKKNRYLSSIEKVRAKDSEGLTFTTPKKMKPRASLEVIPEVTSPGQVEAPQADTDMRKNFTRLAHSFLLLRSQNNSLLRENESLISKLDMVVDKVGLLEKALEKTRNKAQFLTNQLQVYQRIHSEGNYRTLRQSIQNLLSQAFKNDMVKVQNRAQSRLQMKDYLMEMKEADKNLVDSSIRQVFKNMGINVFGSKGIDSSTPTFKRSRSHDELETIRGFLNVEDLQEMAMLENKSDILKMKSYDLSNLI